jgi:putative Mg2+ transporter-C (MgtC) family protein
LDIPLLFDFLVRIGLAVLLGGLIGAERELTRHPAGFRTMILVCMGSTIVMFLPYSVLNPEVAGVNVVLDSTRIAAGVVTGIGFLGAGVIFKEGANVKGLTTAASIWAVANIGLLIGSGFLLLSIFATIIIFMVLQIFDIFERSYFRYYKMIELTLRISNKPKVMDRIEKQLKNYRIKLKLNNFKKTKNSTTLAYMVQLPRSMEKEFISKSLLDFPDVYELTWKT